VTHVGTQRATLAQDLQGGTASLPLTNVPAGGSFESSLSDWLNTLRVPLARSRRFSQTTRPTPHPPCVMHAGQVNILLICSAHFFRLFLANWQSA
jgi:hypothetical protein